MPAPTNGRRLSLQTDTNVPLAQCRVLGSYPRGSRCKSWMAHQICGHSSMVERQFSKLHMRVRFSLPAEDLMPYKDRIQRREYTREWYRKRRDTFFSDKICIKCGSKKEMQLDHIDPDQKVSHRIWSWSKERRDAEIAKCQVLCLECHKKKTAQELWRPITHGNSGYDRFCRCEICKTAHRERMKERVRL